uniref:Uncharacterized protein n=1 Tax=Branchiostoma floridae TaxID=7739 RepID=C3ZGE9_BRAFL|eukprot:XP_002592382.1 hypothetical protein BRAFLDRAFT_67243 [Branchiostoma floridae]
MESGAIPDSDITASSSHRDFAPYQGRLNGVAGHGAWAARANEIGQWLQVDLGEIKRVTGTVIQGRRTTDYRDQFVTSYKLQYRAVWNSWTTYTSSDGSDKVFTGNTNALSPVTNLLDNPVNASHVRFVVQSWHTHICMRVEVLVCSTVFCSSKHVANGTLTWDLPGVKSSPFIFEVKVNTSGSGSGLIYLYRWGDNTTENQDGYRVELRCGQSQIARTTNDTGRDTVANNYSTDITSAEEFRRFWICWSKGGSVGVGRAGEVEPFMSWTDPHPVTDIGKVGYGTWDVPGYFMFHCTRACSNPLGMESGAIPDGSITASSTRWDRCCGTSRWEPYKGRLNGAESWTATWNFIGEWLQVFPCNVDMSTPVTNLLDNPVDARYVRFVVQSWHGRISMRAEILGCNITCPRLLGMESGDIADGSITASSFHREASYTYGLEPRYGRLNAAPTRAWTAGYNFVGQWFQVFPGNVDMSIPVTNLLDNPVDARYVRFVVQTWNDRISMRVEIVGCNTTAVAPVCPYLLGMESGAIPDGSITASSFHRESSSSYGLEPRYGRLNVAPTRAWTAKYNLVGQWLQVFPGNVDMSLPVTNLLDSPVDARYVRFVVLSWNDRIAMRVEIVGCNTSNVDVSLPVTNLLNNPVVARYVRFVVQSWHNRIAMRVEIVGCNTTAVPLPACPQPLGMESGAIPDGSITAPSSLINSVGRSVGLEPYKGRLNGRAAWTSHHNYIGQWLQVDLGEMKLVMGTIIQGRLSHEYQWVTSYKLQYSTDRITWIYADSDGSDMVFPGNSYMSLPVTNLLNNPVDARYVRFVVQSWHNQISMRVEIVGCNTTAVAPVCPQPLGMESGAIPDGSITASSSLINSVGRSAGQEAYRGRLNGRDAWTANHNYIGQWLQVFPGNSDMSLPVTNLLDNPVDARYVRFVVQSWNNHISMRAEIVGCNTTAVAPVCPQPLGMESGAIPDGNIIASSSLLNSRAQSAGLDPYQGRVNGRTAWAANLDFIGQWLQVFPGNVDMSLPITNLLDNPVDARYVRFVIQSWHNRIAMRVEIAGCNTTIDGVRMNYTGDLELKETCSLTKHVEGGTLTWDLPKFVSSPFIFEVKVNTSDNGYGLIYLNTTENQDGYRVVLRSGRSQIVRTTRDAGRDNVASYYSTDMTSGEEFRRFWICWSKGGSVGVGRAGEVEPFMSWTDPHPITELSKIGYGISSVPGEFMFNCSQDGFPGVCVDPPTQANTTGPVCDCPYLLGENCTYPCSPGHHVTSGDIITRKCTTDGSWTEPDLFCQDIDECLTQNGGCSQTCTNNVGSYNCSCSEGFILDGDRHTCTDVDECSTKNGGCSQFCTNTVGSYNCSCSEGFVMGWDGHSCIEFSTTTSTTTQQLTSPTTSPAQPNNWILTRQQTSTARLMDTSTMSTTDVMPTSSTTTVKTTTPFVFGGMDGDSSDYMDDDASIMSPMTTLPTLPPSTAEPTPPPPVFTTTQESSTQAHFLIEVMSETRDLLELLDAAADKLLEETPPEVESTYIRSDGVLTAVKKSIPDVGTVPISDDVGSIMFTKEDSFPKDSTMKVVAFVEDPFVWSVEKTKVTSSVVMITITKEKDLPDASSGQPYITVVIKQRVQFGTTGEQYHDTLPTSYRQNLDDAGRSFPLTKVPSRDTNMKHHAMYIADGGQVPLLRFSVDDVDTELQVYFRFHDFPTEEEYDYTTTVKPPEVTDYGGFDMPFGLVYSNFSTSFVPEIRMERGWLMVGVKKKVPARRVLPPVPRKTDHDPNWTERMTTGRNILVLLVFLLIFTGNAFYIGILGFDRHAYHIRTSLENSLLSEYEEVATVDDAWEWLSSELIPSLHPERGYSGQKLSWLDKQFPAGTNAFRIGPVRLERITKHPVAYGISGNLIFGKNMETFSGFKKTSYVLFEMGLGRPFVGVFADDMKAVDRVMGPLYYSTFVMVFVFYLMNLGVGMLCNWLSYCQTSDDIGVDTAMGDYFWNSFRSLLGMRHEPQDFDVKRDLFCAAAADFQINAVSCVVCIKATSLVDHPAPFHAILGRHFYVSKIIIRTQIVIECYNFRCLYVLLIF